MRNRSRTVLFLAALAAALAMPLAADVNRAMLVDTAWLAGNLDDPAVHVVQVVESPAEYQTGHIPGAHCLLLADIAVDRNGVPNELPQPTDLEDVFERLGVGNRGRIVLVGTKLPVVARAFFTLDYAGHGSRTAILDGGLQKWCFEGRPMTIKSTPGHPEAFFVSPHPENVVGLARLQRIQALGCGDRVALIDARPVAAYRGVEETAGVPRAGHIPGAQNVVWSDNTTGAYETFRSEPELRRLYATAGATPEKLVISYCRTGMQASVCYFVLRYLGYDTALYDGSFVEWSASPATEVARSTVR